MHFVGHIGIETSQHVKVASGKALSHQFGDEFGRQGSVGRLASKNELDTCGRQRRAVAYFSGPEERSHDLPLEE